MRILSCNCSPFSRVRKRRKVNSKGKLKVNQEGHDGSSMIIFEPQIQIEEPLPKEVQNKWKCGKCDATFNLRKHLAAHRKIHKNSMEPDPPTYTFDEERTVYICDSCSAEFATEKQAKEHAIQVHITTYTCEECKQNFTSPYLFSCHARAHSADTLLRCPLCDYTTHRTYGISRHIFNLHYRKYYYNCPTCGKGFNDTATMKEHTNEHNGIKPFVCVVCKNSYAFSRNLNLHQVRYHRVGIVGQLHKMECPTCFKVFSTKEGLSKHLASNNCRGIVHNKTKHLCEICGKGFPTTDKLKVHNRIHTGDKPFMCTFCPKSFTLKEYLITHERVHTGEKPFSCQVCDKSFSQPSPLRIHMRGHTGERPYACDFCNSRYSSKAAMNVHKRSCTGLNS